MRISEVMEAETHAVDSGQTVEHAARRIHMHGLGLVPVRRRDGTVAGVVTPLEIVKAVALARAPELCPVEEVMTREFVCCGPDEDADAVYARALTLGASALLVTSPTGRLVGVVARSRLAAAARPLPPAAAKRLRRTA
jgi:CBS domain-containing protein